MNVFSGSYRQQDVHFLLTRLPLQQVVTVAEKETLIQTGEKHYSEMLSPETLPSRRYLELFRHACRTNRYRMARDCAVLASLIAERHAGPVTIVSLARAGTPVGVIIKHLLDRVFDRRAAHYSLSIIRDRGIDEVALGYVLKRGHAPESIVFVDGWTGKGVISRELAKWVGIFNTRHKTKIDPGLYVLSDLAGTAACASSSNDYLIPSSILNATVSGLVSRSILNDAIGKEDFHGCVYFGHLAPHDQSRAFADQMVRTATELMAAEGVPQAVALDSKQAAEVSRQCLHWIARAYGVSDVNLIKPGIGEATRVLLRRVPRLLILRDPRSANVAHLKLLADEKAVPIAVERDLPYEAISLIRSRRDGG